MLVLDKVITTLEQRLYRFKDGISDKRFITELKAFELDCNLPHSISTFLSLDLNDYTASRMLNKHKSMQMDLHNNYCEIAPLSDLKLKAEDDIDAFLDNILEKQRKIKQDFKDKAKRHYATKNRFLVEEFESNPNFKNKTFKSVHLGWS